MPDEKARRTDEVTELLDTVKAYAKQETVGHRWPAAPRRWDSAWRARSRSASGSPSC